MFRSGWRGDMIAATSRGRCRGYVQGRTAQRRHGVTCTRTGDRYVVEGNLAPEGPYCWQHGRIAEDRATARAIDFPGRLVRVHRIEEVQR